MKEQLSDALLVIDLQNGVCQRIYQREKLIFLVNQRIELYLKEECPIIFVQHNDSELIHQENAWKIISQLIQPDQAFYVQKEHANAFYHTNLQQLLTQLDVESIEICGAQTEYCVDTTVKVAHSLGYQLQMLPNATTTFDNAYMSANNTIRFYEGIWNRRFVTFI